MGTDPRNIMRILAIAVLTLAALALAQAADVCLESKKVEVDFGTACGGKKSLSAKLCGADQAAVDAVADAYAVAGNVVGDDASCKASATAECALVGGVPKSDTCKGLGMCDENENECGVTADCGKKPCCSSIKDSIKKMCKDTKGDMIDAWIALGKNAGGCADSDCYSAGTRSVGSLATSLLVGAFALVATRVM